MSGQKITLVLQHLIVRLRVRVETQIDRPFVRESGWRRVLIMPRPRAQPLPLDRWRTPPTRPLRTEVLGPLADARRHGLSGELGWCTSWRDSPRPATETLAKATSRGTGRDRPHSAYSAPHTVPPKVSAGQASSNRHWACEIRLSRRGDYVVSARDETAPPADV